MPSGGPPRFPGPGSLDRALALVRFLRTECAWDRVQTAESLIPHLLEETRLTDTGLPQDEHRSGATSHRFPQAIL